MQDHRQVKALGQFQLRLVMVLLQRHVQARHKAIEADLAHRHQARVGAVLLQCLGQGLQVGVRGLRREQRVDAQRVNVAVLMR
jgi:hypothetical protein